MRVRAFPRAGVDMPARVNMTGGTDMEAVFDLLLTEKIGEVPAGQEEHLSSSMSLFSATYSLLQASMRFHSLPPEEAFQQIRQLFSPGESLLRETSMCMCADLFSHVPPPYVPDIFFFEGSEQTPWDNNSIDEEDKDEEAVRCKYSRKFIRTWSGWKRFVSRKKRVWGQIPFE